MLCPLLLSAVMSPGKVIADYKRDEAKCIRGQCEWYVRHEAPGREGCAIPVLADLVKMKSMP